MSEQPGFTGRSRPYLRWSLGLIHRLLGPVRGSWGPARLGQLSRGRFPADLVRAAAWLLFDSSDERLVPATRWVDDVRERLRSHGDLLADVTSVPARWGRFLFLCARDTKAQGILELGTGPGISAAYLASAPECQRLVTVDSDATMTGLASEHLARLPQVEVRTCLFHDFLANYSGPRFQLVHIDGVRTPGALQECLRMMVPHLDPGAVILLDDIGYTWEMLRGWSRLLGTLGPVIDAGRYGVGVFTGQPREGRWTLAYPWEIGWRAFDARYLAGGRT